MRIGFDGKRAAKNLTGLGNYSRWLITQLTIYYPENDYLVYASSRKDSPRIVSFFKNPGIISKIPPLKKFLWRTVGILKDLTQDQVKLYHGLSHELPFAIQYTPIASVVTIHDLIFLKYPQYYAFFDRLIYRIKSKSACKHANKIIAISERTKQDIVELYGIAESKIQVIYQSCDDSFKTLLPDETKNLIRKKHNLPEKYILYVGTIEERKNVSTLIEALAKIPVTHKLVIIGGKTKYYSKVATAIAKHQLRSRILIFENMPFEDLPAVYQNAEVFVLPSFYEGFGIPVIEALYSGIPVVAASGSCLEEAGGPNSVYVAPDNVDALAEAIQRVLSDSTKRKMMAEEGLRYVQKFNNQILTNQLMDCYKNICNE